MKPVQAILLSAFVILGISLLSPVIITRFRPEPLPLLGESAQFELLDSNAQTFKSEQLKGSVWVANFFFTNCGGICPFLTSNIRTVYSQFNGISDVKFLSITVDPERDGPSALKDYTDNFSIDTKRWHFLTGTKESINKISLQGFKLGNLEDPSFHTERVVLIDRNLKIRGYYSGTDKKEMKRLTKDIRTLLSESEMS